MIQKLRVKFIAASMLSLALVLLVKWLQRRRGACQVVRRLSK